MPQSALISQKLFLLFVSILVILISALSFALPAQGATSTWDGGGADNNWNTCANWSLDTCPVAADTIVFDGTSTKGVTISTSIRVSSIAIASDYTGTITQGTGAIMITDTLSMSEGIFIGGDSPIIIRDEFALSGGHFTATSDTLSAGAFSHSGGTFVPNNGTVVLNGHLNQSFSPPPLHNLSLSEGLIGYWKLDEEGKDVKDWSGFGNTGTRINEPIPSTNTPNTNFSNPFSSIFDGSNDYIEMSNPTPVHPLKPSFPITISAWFKTNHASSYQNIFSSDNFESTYAGTQLRLSGGNIVALYGNSGPPGPGSRRQKVSATKPSVGTWHHATAVFQGYNDIQIYLDGVNDGGVYGGSAGSLVYDPVPSRIGVFNGNLDDIRIYDRALSADEVAALASGTEYTDSGITYTLEDNLTLNGNFALRGTTLNTSSNNITLAGDWINSGGTFIPGTGTVTLNGSNQVIQGSTTFYNLSKTISSADTLTFDAGSTQTVTGSLTLQGAGSGERLALRSSSPGTAWLINSKEARSLTYLDVQDSTSTTLMKAGTGSINSGRNTNWKFTEKTGTPASSGSGSVTTPKLSLTSFGTVPFKDGIKNWYYTGRRPTFKGVTDPGTTVTVKIHSDPIVCTTTADTSGNWECTPPTDIPDGQHSVTITVTTANGGTNSLSFNLGINVGLAATGESTWPIQIVALIFFALGLFIVVKKHSVFQLF